MRLPLKWQTCDLIQTAQMKVITKRILFLHKTSQTSTTILQLKTSIWTRIRSKNNRKKRKVLILECNQLTATIKKKTLINKIIPVVEVVVVMKISEIKRNKEPRTIKKRVLRKSHKISRMSQVPCPSERPPLSHNKEEPLKKAL